MLGPVLEKLCQQDWGKSPAEIGSLGGAGFALSAIALTRALKRPLVIVVPGAQAQEALVLDLQTFAPDLRTCAVPGEDVSEPGMLAALGAWMPALSAMRTMDGASPGIVLVTAASLLVPLPNPRILGASVMTLRKGAQVGLDALIKKCADAGYERVSDVEQRGQFARRGGIVDIWPHALENPLRIDFFGDDVESVRSIDPASQQSIATLQEISFPLLAPKADVMEDDGSGVLHYLPQTVLPVTVERRETLTRLEGLRPFQSRGNAQLRMEGMLAWLGETPRVDLSSMPVLDRKGAVNIRCTSLPEHERGADAAAETIAQLRKDCRSLHIFAGSEGEAKRLKEALAAHNVALDGVALYPHDISGSAIMPELKTGVVSGAELLGKAKPRAGIRIGQPDVLTVHHRAIEDFIQLDTGDYVVHAAHGIGKYLGTEELRTPDGARGEYLRLLFDGGTEIHVPVVNADQVQKYIGSRGAAPKLSQYNSRAWGERKGRVQQAVIQLATEMLRLAAIRESETGFAYPPGDELEHDFVESFPYRDTPDQEKAWEQIKKDMESPRPVDRLLCGDVGFGKTELAMRAAFKATAAGKQVAVLVPTTVLCQQHWLSFSSRMAGYPVRVESLSRFRSAVEQNRVLAGLKDGSVDVVIGTHRLLSKDVTFKDLGLLVIDEEQRFGVEAKEKLKSMRATVDVLTLTATPIPRTLHMALLGIRDITSLTTPPEDRHPVHTQVTGFDEHLIREAVLRELARDGQVYFVHNRVYDIQEVADRIKRIVPEARIVCGHGQMADGELEEVMLAFINHEADVLVCTTIIESGIDVQSANTMFIDNAQNYGLADLHQLRGRVGRYRHHAHCYLIVPHDARVAEDAQKRLQAIVTNTRLGSGFSIAMHDLEIRGAGNILGAEQSGHIATVGYDMYCQLLQRAVAQLKGGEVISEVETTVELDLDLLLPRNYVAEARQRVQVYRLIARCSTPEGADGVREHLKDRFGKPPKVVERLFMLAVVRRRLGRLGVTSLTIGSHGESKFFRMRTLSAKATLARLAPAQPDFRMIDDETVVLPLKRGLDHAEDQLRYISNLLQSMVSRGMLREVPQGQQDTRKSTNAATQPTVS
ncbi:MAG: transcription-repair coupling factor [Planctomycetes bacterium]|nr:transcription-repair coupling factor [Planctomycetota bacterium]